MSHGGGRSLYRLDGRGMVSLTRLVGTEVQSEVENFSHVLVFGLAPTFRPPPLPLEYMAFAILSYLLQLSNADFDI